MNLSHKVDEVPWCYSISYMRGLIVPRLLFVGQV